MAIPFVRTETESINHYPARLNQSDCTGNTQDCKGSFSCIGLEEEKVSLLFRMYVNAIRFVSWLVGRM
jgi:zona occludens toxin (predicted ATPase)